MASCIYVCENDFACGSCSTCGDIWRVNGTAYATNPPYLSDRTCPALCTPICFFFPGTHAIPYPSSLNLPGCAGLDASNLLVGMEAYLLTQWIHNCGDACWCGTSYLAYKTPTCTTVLFNYIPLELNCDGLAFVWYYSGVALKEIWGNGIICSIACLCGCAGHNDSSCITCMCVCCFDSTILTTYPGSKVWVDGGNIKYTDTMVCQTAGSECGYCHCIKNDGFNHTDWSAQCCGISLWRLNGDMEDSVGSNDGTGHITCYVAEGVDDCGACFATCNDVISVGTDASIDNIWAGGATLSVWARKVVSSESTFIAKGPWNIYTNNNDIYITYLNSTVNTSVWYTTSNPITYDTWYHIAITYDSSSNSNVPILYIDGVSVAFDCCIQPTGTICDDAASTMYLGNCACKAYNWEGTLSQIWLFGEILSCADINNIYNNCKPVVSGQGAIWVPALDVYYLNYIDCKGSLRRTHNGTIFTYNTWYGYEDFLGCTRGAGACGHLWSDSSYNYGLVAINGCGVQYKISQGTVFNNCEGCDVP